MAFTDCLAVLLLFCLSIAWLKDRHLRDEHEYQYIPCGGSQQCRFRTRDKLERYYELLTSETKGELDLLRPRRSHVLRSVFKARKRAGTFMVKHGLVFMAIALCLMPVPVSVVHCSTRAPS